MKGEMITLKKMAKRRREKTQADGAKKFERRAYNFFNRKMIIK